MNPYQYLNALSAGISLNKRESSAINYFREQGATSPEKAITIDDKDAERLCSPLNLFKFGYILQTLEGRYYLDEDMLQQYYSRVRKIGLLFAGLMGFIVLTTVFLILSG